MTTVNLGLQGAQYAPVRRKRRFTAFQPGMAYQGLRLRHWLTFPTILSFAVGLLTNVRFQFGGRASLGETALAVIALLAVLANLGNRRFWDRRVTVILFALTTSLCAYIIADLINATPAERRYRGWARLAFVIVDFVGVWALSRNSIVNLFAICIGDAFSTVLSWGAEHPDFLYNYKFHLAMPLTVLLMLTIPIFMPKSAPKATGIAMVAAGLTHVWFDYRMAGAICIIVGFVLIARCITASRLHSLYLILLLFALLSSSIAIGLTISATNGSFRGRREGSNSQRLALALAGIDAIERSPVFGLGSWVWDSRMSNIYLSRWKLTDNFDLGVGDARGPHSQIIQVWAEAGLLGLVFIFYYGRFLSRGLWILFFKRPLDILSPIFLYYQLLAAWDLVFSPFANLHRFAMGLTAVIAIQILRENKGRLAAGHPWIAPRGSNRIGERWRHPIPAAEA